jgi:hypothetical protein
MRIVRSRLGRLLAVERRRGRMGRNWDEREREVGVAVVATEALKQPRMLPAASRFSPVEDFPPSAFQGTLLIVKRQGFAGLCEEETKAL